MFQRFHIGHGKKIKSTFGNIIYKILGVWCLHEPFCPAPTFVAAESDDARKPQHFIYVTVVAN